jgi:hypothetical protein
VNRSFSAEFGGGFLQNLFAPAANVNRGSEFEEACGHAFAQTGAASGDEDALGVEKIGSEHGIL